MPCKAARLVFGTRFFTPQEGRGRSPRMVCTRACDSAASRSKSSDRYILIWKSRLFRFDLEALTAFGSGIRSAQYLLRYPGPGGSPYGGGVVGTPRQDRGRCGRDTPHKSRSIKPNVKNNIQQTEQVRLYGPQHRLGRHLGHALG